MRKYRAAAQALRETYSQVEIANFFISPLQHPDIVMSVLINKQKAQAADMPVRRAPSRPIIRNVLVRNLVYVCFFMFISCAVAPSGGFQAMVREDIKVENAAPARDSAEVERMDGTLRTGYEVAKHMFSDGPLPAALSNSFASRLMEGDWSGLALIGSDGDVKAMARDGSYPQMSNWLTRYRRLEDENSTLRESLDILRNARDSEEIYLEIDLDNDSLYVKMGSQVLYDFPVVTGKGYLPRTSKWKRRFRTPRGIMTVQKKERWPVWYPPSWHWRERGQEVPSRRYGIRGVLGKYRLNLGNAYGIHGTRSGNIGPPGKRSHGCVRMNRRDLTITYRLCDVGTKVYIY
ncbi:MAG: L,D-transpeptidase [bacterium]